MSASQPPDDRDPEPSVSGHVVALEWIRSNAFAACAFAILFATIAIFYAAMPLFPTANRHLTLSVIQWARSAWNPEDHYEHGPLVPFIALFLVWNALPRLRHAVPRPVAAGLVPVLTGLALFALSARTLEPRLALGGLPILLWGIVLYAAGWRFARVLLFPIACLFFMIPIPGVDQATVQLQLLVADASSVICNAIGIPLTAIGTNVRAADESFNFEIAGGCSGINSLMAITLMTAVFAHLTQSGIIKQIVLFAASIPVAIIGNIARLVAIMIVAKCFGQQIAGGWFHDISSYLISFPFAFAALCLVHKLLNWTPPAGARPAPPPQQRPQLATPLSPEVARYDY